MHGPDIEVYRVKCPDCGVRVEKVPLLPSKAPFSQRFEDAVGQACESAAARQVARRFGLTETPVRAIDLRCLERWAATRREPPLRHMGVDEIYRGKNGKFLTVVSKLETGEPLWFGTLPPPLFEHRNLRRALPRRRILNVIHGPGVQFKAQQIAAYDFQQHNSVHNSIAGFCTRLVHGRVGSHSKMLKLKSWLPGMGSNHDSDKAL